MNEIENATELETSPEARAAGLRRIPRRHLAQHGQMTLRDCQVEITIQIDADVLDYFERRAQLPYAEPYEAQINNELRAVMERDGGLPYASLVNDDKFIAALAERLRNFPVEKAA
jgi:uncharacterized protein (DUF4415 family)